jgi:hypothetical protein
MQNVTDELFGHTGFALGKTHLVIGCDTKYVEGFRHTLESAGVKIVLCPPRVPQGKESLKCAFQFD